MSHEEDVSGPDESDERLLAYLFDTESDLPPTVIAWNLSRRGVDVTREAVARRVDRLERRGLVERANGDRDYYRISDDGVAFLAGTFDVDEDRDAG